MWWTKTGKERAIMELTKLQRCSCLCITGALRGMPIAAMEIVLNLTPIPLMIKAEARMGNYRLQQNKTLKSEDISKYQMRSTIHYLK